MHHDEQIQRVVSPANQTSLAHFQNQYAAYEPYHHRTDLDVNVQHDPRQQVKSQTHTILTFRCKNGIREDSQYLLLLPSKGQCTDTTRLRVKTVKIGRAHV